MPEKKKCWIVAKKESGPIRHSQTLMRDKIVATFPRKYMREREKMGKEGTICGGLRGFVKADRHYHNRDPFMVAWEFLNYIKDGISYL